ARHLVCLCARRKHPKLGLRAGDLRPTAIFGHSARHSHRWRTLSAQFHSRGCRGHTLGDPLLYVHRLQQWHGKLELRRAGLRQRHHANHASYPDRRHGVPDTSPVGASESNRRVDCNAPARPHPSGHVRAARPAARRDPPRPCINATMRVPGVSPRAPSARPFLQAVSDTAAMSIPAEVIANGPDAQADALSRTAFPVLVSLSICHLLNDMIQSLLPAIYPLLKTSFALDFGQIGLITLTFQFTASLLQPLIGTLTDRHP